MSVRHILTSVGYCLFVSGFCQNLLRNERKLHTFFLPDLNQTAYDKHDIQPLQPLMISTTFNRYIWLVNTLIQAGRLTFEEISRKWERSSLGEGKPLPLRTFHDHRKAVEELFQINIECDNSDGYKYYIEDLSSLREDKTRQWLLNSFSTANLITEGKQMKDRILLEEIPEGTEYLQTLIEAMKQN